MIFVMMLNTIMLELRIKAHQLIINNQGSDNSEMMKL